MDANAIIRDIRNDFCLGQYMRYVTPQEILESLLSEPFSPIESHDVIDSILSAKGEDKLTTEQINVLDIALDYVAVTADQKVREMLAARSLAPSIDRETVLQNRDAVHFLCSQVSPGQRALEIWPEYRFIDWISPTSFLVGFEKNPPDDR